MTETEQQIPDGLIVEAYEINPRRLVVFKAYPDLDNNQVLLEPLDGQPYQIIVSPQALLEGGRVSRNLRLVGLIDPQENDASV